MLTSCVIAQSSRPYGMKESFTSPLPHSWLIFNCHHPDIGWTAPIVAVDKQDKNTIKKLTNTNVKQATQWNNVGADLQWELPSSFDVLVGDTSHLHKILSFTLSGHSWGTLLWHEAGVMTYGRLSLTWGHSGLSNDPNNSQTSFSTAPDNSVEYYLVWFDISC